MDNTIYVKEIEDHCLYVMSLIEVKNNNHNEYVPKISIRNTIIDLEFITMDGDYYKQQGIPMIVGSISELNSDDIEKILYDKKINVIKVIFNLYDKNNNFKGNYDYLIFNKNVNEGLGSFSNNLMQEFVFKIFILLNSYHDKLLMIHINGNHYIYNHNGLKEKELTQFKFSSNNLILKNLLTIDCKHLKIDLLVPISKIPDILFSIQGTEDYT